MKQNDLKVSPSQEVESKKREYTKPLDELCEVYDYDVDKALDASFAKRLSLFRIKGVIYCKTRDFRAYLEEEWDAKRYDKAKICSDCGKSLPLFKFAYHGGGKLFSKCRDCHHLYEERHRKGKAPDGAFSNDDEEEELNTPAYKSVDEFVGKWFVVETKSDSSIIESSTMKIEAVVSETDGRTVVLVGKDKNGKICIQKLTWAEIQLLCSEELSLYWSEKYNCIYKKVIISNN